MMMVVLFGIFLKILVRFFVAGFILVAFVVLIIMTFVFLMFIGTMSFFRAGHKMSAFLAFSFLVKVLNVIAAVFGVVSLMVSGVCRQN